MTLRATHGCKGAAINFQENPEASGMFPHQYKPEESPLANIAG